MFKKTLAGLAVAGLFSGAAMAADVNVYGVVDLGLMYQHTKQDVLSPVDVSADKDNSFTMESGQNAGSRFGLRGSEDLGNGLTVSFKLENGFSADSGKLGNDGRLFGREAQVTLAGAFGQVSFGRMGGVASAAGTYDYVFANGDAFDGFDNSVGALVTSSRYDNMITYQTPEFGGMKVLAQYSFKNDTKDEDDTGAEGKSNTNRYASLAAVGQYGNLNLVAAYELQNFAREDGMVQPDDQHTFYVGGNYDFGVTKVFGMAQHFAGARSLNGFDVARDTVADGKTDASDGFRGWGATIGAQTPVAGGLLTTAFYYVDATVEGKITNSAYGLTARERVGEADYNYYGLAARYEYSLSKRTTAYAGAGYAKEKVDENEGKLDADLVQAYVGLKHTF